MKGIILAGGSGSRLDPLTKVTSKQLLPVYDQPMIWYPLQTLLTAGIKDILIIVAPEKAGEFLYFLGSGKEYGARFIYEIQDKPSGLPEAFIIAEHFIDDDNVTMILGDNIFEDDFSEAIRGFKSGGKIFVKEVDDPSRYGVVKFDVNNRVEKIIEKPQEFISPYANVGLYIFDSRVIEIAKNLKSSSRGETEITDIHKYYLEKNELEVDIVKGEWIDAGTIDSLLKANNFIASKRKNQSHTYKA